MQITNCTAIELSDKIKKGDVKVAEAVEAVFGRIAQTRELNYYITAEKEAALQKASVVQRQIDSGKIKGPLAGVPFAVKDNLCTEGMLTTCGSKMLERFVPGYSAEAVRRLEAAGAILIGKTNMDEFAMGSTTETSYYGAAKNPINAEYVTGGSSGGSAGAVAAGSCFMALGSDTGGSVRQPASHCGVVGLKPTYGSVSRYGLVAHASSLDQIGPITKDVRDSAAVFQVICAYDEKDATSVKCRERDFLASLEGGVTGMRIGLPKAYFGQLLQEEVRKPLLLAAEIYRKKGAVVEEFELPLVEYGVPAYYTISTAEASSNLERFDGIKYGWRCEENDDLKQLYRKTRSNGFGDEVKRRIMLGTFVLSAGYYEAYYLQALKAKSLIKKAYEEAFKKYDILLTPVAPSTAPCLGDSQDNPLKRYPDDMYTVSANLAGIPAMSIPCGQDANGLPVGMQLMADCFQEEKLFRAAYIYEQERICYV